MNEWEQNIETIRWTVLIIHWIPNSWINKQAIVVLFADNINVVVAWIDGMRISSIFNFTRSCQSAEKSNTFKSNKWNLCKVYVIRCLLARSVWCVNDSMKVIMIHINDSIWLSESYFCMLNILSKSVCGWTSNRSTRVKDRERETRSMEYNFIWRFLCYLHWFSTAFSSIFKHTRPHFIFLNSVRLVVCWFGRSVRYLNRFKCTRNWMTKKPLNRLDSKLYTNTRFQAQMYKITFARARARSTCKLNAIRVFPMIIIIYTNRQRCFDFYGWNDGLWYMYVFSAMH